MNQTILWKESEMGKKAIVQIGRLLNLKRFICKKAQFVIMGCLIGSLCIFLSIGF